MFVKIASFAAAIALAGLGLLAFYYTSYDNLKRLIAWIKSMIDPDDDPTPPSDGPHRGKGWSVGYGDSGGAAGAPGRASASAIPAFA